MTNKQDRTLKEILAPFWYGGEFGPKGQRPFTSAPNTRERLDDVIEAFGESFGESVFGPLLRRKRDR